MKIALVLNTRHDNTEFQVEYDPPHTIDMIKSGIEEAGHEYVFIEADENAYDNFRKLKPDLVFNRSEGSGVGSREAHIPALLEILRIPFIGSNVLTLAVCLNKAWTKKMVAFHGVTTPEFYVADSMQDCVDIPFPAILKPNAQGSSIGINEDNLVQNSAELKSKLAQLFDQYREAILVEQFVTGREISVGVLGNAQGILEALPPLEVDFSKLPEEVAGVFGQRAKVTYDDLDNYICPADLSPTLQKKVIDTALKVCKVLEIQDFARMDFRIDAQERVYFLEINPLPGMDFDLSDNDFSFYPLMAQRAGLSYSELIKKLVESACARYSLC